MTIEHHHHDNKTSYLIVIKNVVKIKSQRKVDWIKQIKLINSNLTNIIQWNNLIKLSVNHKFSCMMNWF